MAKKRYKPHGSRKRSSVRTKRSKKRRGRKRVSRDLIKTIREASVQAENMLLDFQSRLLNATAQVAGLQPIINESLGKAIRDLRRFAQQARPQIEQFEELARSLAENPFFRTMDKMNQSKGVLQRLKESGQVIFIPDAVLYYGFAHLPTKSDPEGKLFEKLPPEPPPAHRSVGAYLFTPERPSNGETIPRSEDDPLYRQAEQVYDKSRCKGLAPSEVLNALIMASGIEKVWLEIDPQQDLNAQMAQLRRWLGKVPRQLYRRSGSRRHAKRNAPRDTLIYILSTSAGKGNWFIARKLSISQTAVRKSIERSRAALKAIDPPSSSSSDV